MVRSPPPLVTGISPKEGPPGSRVTIRGENLGTEKRDIIGLKICGVDCFLSLTWHSSKRISARTALAKGKGDIIVTTKSGGVGSSTVQFKGYNIQITPLEESNVWMDETKSNSAPAVEHYSTDPLGLQYSSNELPKLSEEELQELLPDGSGNINLENFDPAWFLLENHQSASFDDLKRGAENLRQKLSSYQSDPFTFAKNNLPTFFQCLDTLTEVSKRMEEDEKLDKQTAKLKAVLTKAKQSSEVIFTEVLGRKEKADITQNGLAVLNRYKMLFHLPNTMKKNIEKGDYDLVITDYMRTNSLTWLKTVPAFAKVFEEIEQRVAEFKGMLHRKLLQLPSTLEEQKRLIRYITHLDASSDAAWDCISNYHTCIRKMMHQCQTDHVNKEKDEAVQQTSLSSLLASFKASEQTPNSTYNYNSTYKNKGSKVPPRVSFVEQLSSILCEHLPHLFKLGSSYFDGKLDRKATNPDEARKAEFKAFMHKNIESYSNLIRRAFLPESITSQSMLNDRRHDWPIRSQDNSLASWLPMCVKNVRSSISLLQPLELAEESTSVLLKLDWLLRSNCVDCILNQAIIEVKGLGAKEVWTLNANEGQGCTTLLPALFEGIVSDVIASLHDVISDQGHERKLFTDESKSKKKTHTLCISLLQSFATTLYELANSSEDEAASAINSSLNDSNVSANSRRVSRGKGKKSEELPKDKKLLIILNNSSMTSRLTIPRLLATLQQRHYPVSEKDSATILKAYNGLYEEVFKQYIGHKVDSIVAVLEHNMNLPCVQWSNYPVPIGVGYYVKECLLALVTVHAEVCSIGPVFVQRVVEAVVEATVEEAGRVLQCVASFDRNAALQARLDLEALDYAAGAHKTSETKKLLRDTLKVIPELNKEQCISKDKMMTAFKTQMFFYLQCFRPSP